jgi:putative ABC transport system substrate-binding protein
MRRREFIAATTALLVSPRHLYAQGRPRRIGFLGFLDPTMRDVWRGGLREKGWIEGKNLLVEYRYTQPTDRWTSSARRLALPARTSNHCVH